MRWRFNGTNWEGRFWTLTSGLQVLAQQVFAQFPEGYVVDGTVAGKPHDEANPNSEHRPHPTAGAGIVRAIDIGIGAGEDVIFEQLRLSRDPRIKYVIFKGRKFQGAPGSIGRTPWEWYPYTGANPHNSHGHVSVWPTADSSSKPWNILGGSVPPPPGGGDDMASPAQKTLVALAFNLFPVEVKGDPNFWLNLPEDDSQWANFDAAVSKGAGALYAKVQAGVTDAVARLSATRANDRLDKLDAFDI